MRSASQLERKAMNIAFLFVGWTLAVIAAQPAVAQETPATQPSLEEIAKLKQNPVGGLRTIFFQDVVAPFGEGTANALSIQPVWPFRLPARLKLITYTILPIQYLPPASPGGQASSGLGNILFNGFITRENTTHHPFQISAGPAAQIPTRTDAGLGSNRLSLGPAGLVYLQRGHTSGGVILQNLWSLGGDDDNDVDLFSAQYFLAHNLPGGWFVQSNATITADWTASSPDRWTVPVGGGAGRIFALGGLYYSVAGQGLYNAMRPTGVGAWTLIGQFQVIFGQ